MFALFLAPTYSNKKRTMIRFQFIVKTSGCNSLPVLFLNYLNVQMSLNLSFTSNASLYTANLTAYLDHFMSF